MTNQSQGSSQPLSQSQGSSQTDKRLKPGSDESSQSQSRLQNEPHDMQTEEELLNVLESGEDDSPIKQHEKKKISTTLNITSSDEHDLMSGIHSESEKLNKNDIPETMDLQESEELNLQLDMSVTETMGAPDSDHTNLQLALSVTETDDHSSDDKNVQRDGQKLTDTVESLSKGLNLRLDVSTDEHSSEECSKRDEKRAKCRDSDSESAAKNLILQLDTSTDEQSSEENTRKDHGKLANNLDVVSESTCKSLNLQLDVSTGEHSAEERNTDQDGQKRTDTMDADSESMSIL
jgi:hypothetical protein